MKIYLLVFILWINGLVCYGQYKLSGKVSSMENGQVLRGATLRVKEYNMLSTTDSTGTFRLNLPAKTVILEVSYVGFVTQVTKINLPVSDINIQLKTAAIMQVKEIFVSTGYQDIPADR